MEAEIDFVVVDPVYRLQVPGIDAPHLVNDEGNHAVRGIVGPVERVLGISHRVGAETVGSLVIVIGVDIATGKFDIDYLAVGNAGPETPNRGIGNHVLLLGLDAHGNRIFRVDIAQGGVAAHVVARRGKEQDGGCPVHGVLEHVPQLGLRLLDTEHVGFGTHPDNLELGGRPQVAICVVDVVAHHLDELYNVGLRLQEVREVGDKVAVSKLTAVVIRYRSH